MRSGAAGTDNPRPVRVKAIREIYKIVDTAVDHAGLPKTAMVSVLLKHEGEADEVVKSFPPDKVMLALDFSPRQRTYAIVPDYEEEAMRAFASAGIRTIKTSPCATCIPARRRRSSRRGRAPRGTTPPSAGRSR